MLMKVYSLLAVVEDEDQNMNARWRFLFAQVSIFKQIVEEMMFQRTESIQVLPSSVSLIALFFSNPNYLYSISG